MTRCWRAASWAQRLRRLISPTAAHAAGLAHRAGHARGETFLRPLRCEPLEDRRVLSILLVDADAPAGGDGLAWPTAYNDLQNALSQAAALNADADTGNDIDAIWIAEGTYKPSALLESGDARSASFSLVKGVTLYGGFAGVETDLDQRDWTAHVVTLSGDIGTPNDNADNAYTVVLCGEAVGAGLDGVSITGGNADGTYNSSHPERRDGGGICNSGTLTVTNCTLADNSAGSGGGINNSNSLTITESTFAGNSAGSGGGINNSNSLTITESTFAGNSAGDGGGIHNYGTLTATNSAFSGNSASYGGAILSEVDGTLTVTGCMLSTNSAEYYGGGICGTDGGTLTITQSTFSGNSARNGGGIANSGSEAGMVRDCTFLENSASEDGGGIRNTRQLVVTDCTLSGNSAGDGGGIFSAGTLTVTHCTLVGNEASYDGGGIRSGAGTLTIASSTLSDNSANRSGGGIFNYSGTLTVEACAISSNSAGGGGAIVNTYFGTLSIVNSTLSQNSAMFFGGGVGNSDYGTVTVANCTLTGNWASYDGGGLYNQSPGTLAVMNSTLSDNSAGEAGGGIHGSGSLTVTNSTLCTNSANNGGGIDIELSSSTAKATLNNTIVAGNSASTGPDIRHASGGLSGSFNLIGNGSGQTTLKNGVNGNQVGTADAPIDPMLDSRGAPVPGSLAINRGSNVLAVDAQGIPLATDRAGRQRILYGTVDVGAFEFGLPGDASQDYQVNAADAAILGGHWLAREGVRWADGDFNDDGAVDDLDLAILAANWLRQTPPVVATGEPDPPQDPVAEPTGNPRFIGPRQLPASRGAAVRLVPLRANAPIANVPSEPVEQASDAARIDARRFVGPIAWALESEVTDRPARPMKLQRIARPAIDVMLDAE